MNYLKAPFLRYREWRRPSALESSNLGQIPLELLLQITDSLPVHAAAIFSISCMQLKRLLGNRYVNTLSLLDEEKIYFLELLALDLADQVSCSYCMRLHKVENAKRYLRLSSMRPAPACLPPDYGIGFMIGPGFRVVVFQMAMKRYR
jgi:alkylhydroperoxidase family enzyme